MRIGAIGETLRERLAVWLRLGPRPLLETHGTLLLAQSLMVATKLGVFESLATAALTAREVAARCGTDAGATAKLLRVLDASGYVRTAADGKYSLASDARRWLLKDAAHSLRDNLLFRFVELDWIGQLEQFVVSGAPLDIHAVMSGAQWDLYQRGMRSLAGALVREVAWRTPVPRGARTMLDIGGAHGLFSAALCRRHAGLHAVVLDLPEAVVRSDALYEPEGPQDRVVHRAGDARVDDLGTEHFDLVFVANLLHHFGPSENRDLIRRAARALRPGGMLVIQELFALGSEKRIGQIATLAELYFALTSTSGTLSVDDLALWQREAGLRPQKPIRFVSFPGAGQQHGAKPR